MVIFVAGLVGVGKSAIARRLAERLFIDYYDIDTVKKAIYPQDPDFERNIRNGIPFKEETRLKVFHKVINDFPHLAQTRKHLVVDESLHLRRPRQILFDAAQRYFGGYAIVWVKADEAIIQERLKSKERKGHILKEPLKMYRSFAKEFESFDECHLVCENNGTIEEAADSVIFLIQNLASLKP
ncbi:MAG: AAA family ATPase [Deltaproteobacteria bacterium]|nr:AAA family ATPase [Deltaproteobacteria bacterium]